MPLCTLTVTVCSTFPPFRTKDWAGGAEGVLSAVNQPNILDRLNMSEFCCGINRFMLDKQRGYYTYCEVIDNLKILRTSQSTKASGRCGK